MFTPMNIVKKCIFNQEGFNDTPVKRGNQCAIPAKIPKTAPMDRT